MSKPLVAIVGRPNVGKSMLFNTLTGRRTSIVEDTPGVTRDRIYGDCEWCGRKFSLVDTGGIEPGTENDMLKFMRRQAEIAIETMSPAKRVRILFIDFKVNSYLFVGLCSLTRLTAAQPHRRRTPATASIPA